MKKKPTVTPCQLQGSHRTGTLKNMTVAKISKVLGFKPNVDDDPDKVKNSWEFKTNCRCGCERNGAECGIWDYKGSYQWNEFSTYGPDEVFVALFGSNYSKL